MLKRRYAAIQKVFDGTSADTKSGMAMKAFNLLKVLTPFAFAMLILVFLVGPGLAAADGFEQSYSVYDGLLKKYVTQQGRVDYAGLKAAPGALERFLGSIAEVPRKQFDTWTESRQLAFLINLYNAATLKLIIDHYPVDSIKNIGGFFRSPWDIAFIRLFDATITLNHLEHGILRKHYREPRIHMALVCAAKGCPPLRNEAYTAEKLDSQLEDQSFRYLASAAGLRIDRRENVVYMSSIFKWYGDDFRDVYTPEHGFDGLNKTERAVANFCSRHLSAAAARFLEKGGYDIEYLDYDWSLNRQ
jgi:hypothetical protein